MNYLIIGQGNSPAASETCNAPSLHSDAHSDAQKYSPNTVQGNSVLHEEFPGFSNPNDIKQSGRQCYVVVFSSYLSISDVE